MMTLVDHGFARVRNLGKMRRFVMQSPSVVQTALDARRKEAEMRLAKFEHVLPRLRALHTVGGSAPVIRYVEGVEGLRSIQEEFEALSGEILQLFDYDAFARCEERRATDRHRDAITGRQRAVRSMVVARNDAGIRTEDRYMIRTIPSSLFQISGEISVCEDRVLLLSYAPDFSAVVIRSSVIADVCRATLELAWRTAGEIEKWMK